MNSASARASSVLPTPVGPMKRNVPIGRFGSWSPARERRSAFDTASTASSWPTTRSWRRSSMWISFSTSPSISFETGMPVHLATTSATSSSSTSSLKKRRSPVRARLGLRPSAALELGDVAVAQLRRRLEVGLALGALDLAVRVLEPLLRRRRSRRARPSRSATRPSSPAACSRSSASSCSIASRRAFEASSFSFVERLLLDLELHDPALDLVDLGRHRVDLHPHAATRPRRSGRSPCRAGSGRRCSGARASPRRRAPCPGCGRGGGSRSAPSARAGSRSCPRPTARRRAPAGTAARARRPSRCACGTRRAWWRRPRAARRARASASAGSRRRRRPRPRRRRRSCAARRGTG